MEDRQSELRRITTILEESEDGNLLGKDDKQLLLPRPILISHGCRLRPWSKDCEAAPKLPGKENPTD